MNKMAIVKLEVMHVSCPQHLRMGTAKRKTNKRKKLKTASKEEVVDKDKTSET